MATQRTRWRELLPGLITLAVLAVIAGVVLVYARIGALHGDTYTLHAATLAARGVIEGTDVWLEGQRVGIVQGIRFAPVSRDTTSRLILDLQILERHRPLIRRDSYAQIRSGGSLIGAPVVYISAGTTTVPELADGDTIASKVQVDPESLSSAVALAARQLPEIVRSIRGIGTQVRRQAGALGDDGRGVPLGVVSARAANLTERATQGDGTVGQALRSRDLRARIDRTMARTDSIRALLGSDTHVLGRFRRDSSLLREMASVRDELSILRTLLEQPAGSAGRLMKDRALALQLAALEREMTKTIEDVKRDPLRYIHF